MSESGGSRSETPAVTPSNGLLGSCVSASRALETRISSLPYLLLANLKAAVGYHPFGRPGHDSETSFKFRSHSGAGYRSRWGSTPWAHGVQYQGFLGCVWHVSAGPKWLTSSLVSVGTVTRPYLSDSEFKFAHIRLVHD